MGSGGSSFASQLQQATVADLQKVVADFTPEERDRVKVPVNVLCGGVCMLVNHAMMFDFVSTLLDVPWKSSP